MGGRILLPRFPIFCLGFIGNAGGSSNCPNFMNRKDPDFQDLTGALQVRYRERCRCTGSSLSHFVGIGATVPSLYRELTFCRRGGQEQRQLILSARLIPTVTPMSSMGLRIFLVLIRNK